MATQHTAEFDYILHTSARVTHKLVVVEEYYDIFNRTASLRIFIERKNSGREHDAKKQEILLKINDETVINGWVNVAVLPENGSDVVELQPSRDKECFTANYDANGTKNVKIELTYKSEQVNLVLDSVWGTIATSEVSFDLPPIDMSLPEISNISVKADRYGLNASASFTASHKSYKLKSFRFTLSGLTWGKAYYIYREGAGIHFVISYPQKNESGLYSIELFNDYLYTFETSLISLTADLDIEDTHPFDSGASYPWELTVTAYNGKTVTRTGTLKVPQKVTGVTCENQLEISLGKTDKLEYQVEPYNAEYPAVEFSSSDPSVATVDKNTGLITAVDDGMCQITVTTLDGGSPNAVSGFSATCIVSVINTDVFPKLSEIRYLTVREISRLSFACTFLRDKLSKKGVSVPELANVFCEGKSHPVKEIKSLLETIESNCQILKSASSAFYPTSSLAGQRNLLNHNEDCSWFVIVNEWITFLNELNTQIEKEA